MAVKKTVKTEAKVANAPRYTLAELMTRAKDLFDVKQEVMAGAFYGLEDKQFTVSETKEKIEQFMKAKVD
ncbi:hypothetical protein GRF59_13220 [Paenibacillus sp. HJL G12]|uniref:YqzN/YkzM domain-containing protein n=1 Tax=Paenibacillus dendrobii TaxID=2691084 RepID=A0A7X3IIL0_9BACL|nr:hypothetical protein [Paenibacillus dendrobii]MWV44589.1 hypothetical protein [Paenibacillus dendrobii]